MPSITKNPIPSNTIHYHPIQQFQSSKVQIPKFQNYKVSKIQIFEVSKFQKFKSSELSTFQNIDFRILKKRNTRFPTISKFQVAQSSKNNMCDNDLLFSCIF